MKVLLTGSTGFLGRVITESIGSSTDLMTLSRSRSSTVTADITDSIPNLPSTDIVVHAAGKAHVVPKNKYEKRQFFKVNHEGTVNLLDKLPKDALPKSFVFISTVAVYGQSIGKLISEDFTLQGETAYAKSKIKAEEAVREWGKKNDVNAVILRLPLIAGPNPLGNLKSLISAIKRRYYFRIGKGNNRKSIVLAEDVGHLIPELIDKNGTYNLTDGQHPTIAALDSYIADKLSRRIKVLPEGIAQLVANAGDFIPKFPLDSERLKKLTGTLTFSDKKAERLLGWSPNKVIGGFDLS